MTNLTARREKIEEDLIRAKMSQRVCPYLQVIAKDVYCDHSEKASQDNLNQAIIDRYTLETLCTKREVYKQCSFYTGEITDVRPMQV